MSGTGLTHQARTWIALATLFVALLLIGAGLATFGWVIYGARGVLAALLATGVCGLSGTAALLCVVLIPDPQQSVGAVLGGMLFRMGVPMLFGMWLYQSQSPMLEVGIAGMLVIAYLGGLFVETALAWWVLSSTSDSSGMVKVS